MAIYCTYNANCSRWKTHGFCRLICNHKTFPVKHSSSDNDYKKQYKTGRRQFQYDIESCTSIHVILHLGRIHVIYCLAFNLAQILYSSYTTPTHLMNSKHIIWEHGLLLHLVCKHLQLSPSSLELKH